jgi:DNA-binding CsgD family transcriptional regulator
VTPPPPKEVLRLIAQGMSNTEISDSLVIAAGTTKTHVKRILAKLGLRDRAQAVVMAYESGLVAAASNAHHGGRVTERRRIEDRQFRKPPVCEAERTGRAAKCMGCSGS